MSNDKVKGFSISGQYVFPTKVGNFTPRVPEGTYIVSFDPRNGFYLTQIPDFEIEHKIYGNTNKLADRILTTFDARPKTTGILLEGEKGSGKTLLAKKISIDGRAKGITTLLVNSAFAGDEFNEFIQSIEQPCIIIFDEFEKVYNKDDAQNAILTLFDGVFPTKKLFVLTVNSTRLSPYMMNRPGRIFYKIRYGGLEEQFIREYCEDNLNDKSKIADVLSVCSVFDSMNFDMLTALVEEMNRYNESARESLQFLNAQPNFEAYSTHTVDIIVDGSVSKTEVTTLDRNPMLEEGFAISLLDSKSDVFKAIVSGLGMDTVEHQQPVVKDEHSNPVESLDDTLVKLAMPSADASGENYWVYRRADGTPIRVEINVRVDKDFVSFNDKNGKYMFDVTLENDGKSVNITLFVSKKRVTSYNWVNAF